MSDLLGNEKISPWVSFEANYQSAYIAEHSESPELALKHNQEAEKINTDHKIFDNHHSRLAGLRTNLSMSLRQANEFDLAKHYADLSIRAYSNDRARRIKAKINMGQVLICLLYTSDAADE